MEGKSTRKATDYFHPFPKAEDVFASRVQQHNEYLLPVATLALDQVSPDLKGHIHLVMPIEPAPGWGCVGDRTQIFHNYLCRPNWIGYQMANDKLELACDFRYFHKAYFLEYTPRDRLAKSEAEDLESHYDKTRAEFESRRQFFSLHGLLFNSSRPYRDGKPIEVNTPGMGEPMSLIDNLGGLSYETNWAATNFPLVILPHPNEEEAEFDLPIAVPLTEDGREFVFVGSLEFGTYLGVEGGGMMVFYDPMERVLLTTFDWS